jgi:nitrile hydratase accessory protein
LSPPDPDPIGPLVRRDGEPVFDEPWQAQALATALSLVEDGLFSREAWSEALGAELRRAEQAGAPDTAETYYQAVVATLERLVTDSGAASAEALAERRESWRRAYLETPHGQPVELSRRFDPARD